MEKPLNMHNGTQHMRTSQRQGHAVAGGHGGGRHADVPGACGCGAWWWTAGAAAGHSPYGSDSTPSSVTVCMDGCRGILTCMHAWGTARAHGTEEGAIHRLWPS